MLAVVLAITFVPSVALAQDPPPPEDVGWNLDDPVNHAESRAFFGALWEAHDAGVEAPPFEFTNTPPGLMTAMLLPELEVFTALYCHRLQLEFGVGPRYLVTDLIGDDPIVRSQFRTFVLAGKLAPQPEVDAEAFLEHYLLVLDALTLQQRATVESTEWTDMSLESEGLTMLAPPPIEGEPSGEPSDLSSNEVRCWLRCLVERSRLNKCLYGLFEHTEVVGPADMDCDDYADAFLRFVLRLLPPGWTGQYGLVYRVCKNDAGKWVAEGHAVSVFRDSQGDWWWVDPRAGKVGGPKESEESLLKEVDIYYGKKGGCRSFDPVHLDRLIPMRQDVLYELPVPEGLSKIEGESKPWWQSAARRQALCERLLSCCRQSVYGPCTPALELPPLGPMDCDLRHYMPHPFPEWNEEWGQFAECTAAGPP